MANNFLSSARFGMTANPGEMELFMCSVITVLGGLLSEKLIRRFEYLEMVVVDTRIHDENLTQLLLETYKEGIKPSVHHRLEAVGEWVHYLQREEEIELTGRRGCQVFGLAPIGPNLQNTWEREKERVLASLLRKEKLTQSAHTGQRKRIRP